MKISKAFLKYFFLIIFSFLFILSTQSLAFYKEVEKIVTGFGSSPREAIEDALEEAIKSTYGLTLEGTVESYTKYNETFKNSDNDQFYFYSKITKKIQEKYKGFIDKYEILNLTRENENGTSYYIAKLKVTLKIYEEPGIKPKLRRKIVIYPFPIKNMNINLDSKENLEKIFYDELVSYFTGSRKFAVLNRDKEKEILKELIRTSSPLTDKKEILKLGKQLVADYILVGEILNLNSYKDIKGSKKLGWYSEETKLSCDVSYKIISVPTGQIKYSNVLHIQKHLSHSDLNYRDLSLFFKDIAQKIEKDILYSIFPPKVIYVDTKKNKVIINYGNKILKPGQKFIVYKINKPLYDPYTKEFIDYEMEKIGIIKIKETYPKYSIGEIIKGKAYVNSVLYPLKEKKKINSQKNNYSTSPIKVLPGGGVILPWDKK